MKFGIAIAAKIPMIATTIINSIRVKPFCALYSLSIGSSLFTVVPRRMDHHPASWTPLGLKLRSKEPASRQVVLHSRHRAIVQGPDHPSRVLNSRKITEPDSA